MSETFNGNNVTNNLDNHTCYSFGEQEIPLGCPVVRSCIFYNRYNQYASYNILSLILQM